MKKQVFNPYLPSWEYIPDGEPHVFGDRVYVYGSHDRFGANFFCVNNYVCWSAPVDDLTNWKYEGVIYRREQDSLNKNGHRSFFAPDVAKGTDGKYYLYYTLDFFGKIAMSVAVCDTPAGQYEFLGHVTNQDGHVWGSRSGEPYPFDPAIFVDDDGRVFLYAGFATKMPAISTGFRNLTNEGGVVLELEKDMLTIKTGPELIFPRKNLPGAYENHAFFEASSIRKVGNKYCFVYSSEQNHELCYAMGENPKGPFQFGGTLVDLGDLFLDGNVDEKHAKNYLGNTHGGLLNVKGQWYIFYHRQTNRHSYSRQACAEKLRQKPDGGFYQAEVTSCGLSDGPLNGIGQYPAYIACHLWSAHGTARYDMKCSKMRLHAHPYFTQSGTDREQDGDQYIANMRDGAVAGFQYFDMKHLQSIAVEIRGKVSGKMMISTTPDFTSEITEIQVSSSNLEKHQSEAKCTMPDGICALYFKYIGKGKLDFISFTLS